MPVAIRSHLRRFSIQERVVTRVAQHILYLVHKSDTELSLNIVGNDRIQRLNRIYRRKNRPTDVLAFPLRAAPCPTTSLLGDVVISLPMASAQAIRLGHSLNEEFLKLLIHGILHLVGYDHEQSSLEAQRMRHKEQAIFQAFQPIPNLARIRPLRRSNK